MLIFILIIGLFFLAVAVTMVMRAVGTPAGRSSDALEQIVGHLRERSLLQV